MTVRRRKTMPVQKPLPTTLQYPELTSPEMKLNISTSLSPIEFRKIDFACFNNMLGLFVTRKEALFLGLFWDCLGSFETAQ